MNKKGLIVSGILIIALSFIITTDFYLNLKNYEKDNKKQTEIFNVAKYNYQVYLDGEKVGIINSKDDLYSLINKEQGEIKNEYNVDQVYPPKGFQIIKTKSYNDDLTTVEDVYNSIKEEKQFTIKGYTITIKSQTEGVEPIYIYVLDEEVFNKAINNVVETFIGQERYQQYKDNTQPEIVDTGYIIDNMYFQQTITIKESYISVDEKIYTDVNSLTKYLLFGDNNNQIEYTVKQGDTIENIAFANQLNTSELLIANDKLSSEDTLLAIGDTLNVALINPVLSLLYEEIVVADVETQYNTIYEEDSTQYVGYVSTRQNGIKGIDRVTYRAQFINGEQNQGAVPLGNQTIKEAQNEIIVKGTKKYVSQGGGGITGVQIDTGKKWGWPTNQPYLITSEYGYRWGTLHDGMDISGTGYGSPIYASLDGVVVSAQYGGMVGSSAGKNVVIEHNNGYYTVYAHMSDIYVSVGQVVSRGQKVGAMGRTGVATGTHLHFGVFYGKPYNGGYSINPRKLWK
ncbi:MAG: peptidoglycan DD-metalloendopeptidase family protein [Candidatus Coprovivens sp.]